MLGVILTQRNAVEWKPFFLNPHIPEGVRTLKLLRSIGCDYNTDVQGVPVLQYLEQKYGKSRDFTAVAAHLKETGIVYSTYRIVDLQSFCVVQLQARKQVSHL
jgi:hypothetical protein